ncbi:MAG TPA: AMP-binding protein, partial [Gemmatimonadaceae bacterium]|nr:AMP-binding protein [Gemmatimonadaceae bacterium]
MPDIDVLLHENRKFPPSEDFRQNALVSSPEVYDEAARDPEGYWAARASELQWSRKWDKVLDWKPPHAQWFIGGKLNASVNCLDRHLTDNKGDKRAIIWEGEPGDERTLTYSELHREVVRFGAALRSLGVKKGDRVAIYLPMIPEAAVAMLACARIGAIHSVVFGGFSPESLRDRIIDAECKLLITADGSYRRGAVVALKRNADLALEETPSIEKVVVVQRWRVAEGAKGAGIEAPMTEGRDIWYHDLVANVAGDCPPEEMDAEDVLFILYTSGTTGKPKGIVHTTGGYLTGAASSTKIVFDLRDDDVFWCTADIGWVTGHSYLVYGPLANGATCVMYEGAPDSPGKDRFWDICQRRGVTILYTAPTAIRAFMKWGTEFVDGYDLSRLRLLGSVGEPINPEAWIWYHERIGKGRCP